MTIKEDRKNIDIIWSKYKYVVMERSYKEYKEISKNIGLNNYTYKEFNEKLNKVIKEAPMKSQVINTVHHIWGYFKKVATEEEKTCLFEMIKEFEENRKDLTEIKKLLKEYAIKYESKYLLHSYYFDYN
ncbi:YbgA family protein [Clostridium sp. ATCC 25772]|uniref:YbgA family protein n=1 Tax=Clostridium sp. ATCC 25772 TaxID=1676991 RepID=UPI00078115D2|nr:YbgA family protein [Clostridium sp. ATCC 25772]